MRLYNKDQEVIQQGSEGYTTRIRRLLAGFFWYQCYYLHWLRDNLSSVCRIFICINYLNLNKPKLSLRPSLKTLLFPMPWLSFNKGLRRHCKHLQQLQSQSVELIFAPWLEKNSGLTLVPNQRYDIQLSESLKKIVVCNHSFTFRQFLVPKITKFRPF